MPNASSGAAPKTPPKLIFVHGGFCDRHDWDDVIARLGPRYDAVSFDLPGHGASKPAGDASIGAAADALNAVRRRQGDQSVILIAHSAGCRVALESYRCDPRDVIGLILVDGGQLLGEGDPTDAVRAFSETLTAIGFHDLMRAGFDQSAASVNATVRERILARVRAHDPIFGRDFLLSAVAWDAGRAAPALAGVSVPLLIVQAIGALDAEHATPTPWSRLVLAHAPLAQLNYVPGGHFVMLEQTETLCEIIDRFATAAVRPASGSTLP